jgi:hypothetical protein
VRAPYTGPMNKPVPANDDRLPISTMLIVGGLALFGAITLVGWIIGFALGVLRFVIVVAVIVGVLGLVAGRRFGDG